MLQHPCFCTATLRGFSVYPAASLLAVLRAKKATGFSGNTVYGDATG
jgi:hypothetical protein